MPYLTIFALVLTILLIKHPLPVKGLMRDIRVIHNYIAKDPAWYFLLSLTAVWIVAMLLLIAGGGE